MSAILQFVSLVFVLLSLTQPDITFYKWFCIISVSFRNTTWNHEQNNICIIMYISNHENNVPSRLSPHWFCGNSCTCVNDVHHVPQCMSCHKAIVVITGRAHCFCDSTYIYMWYILYIYHIRVLAKKSWRSSQKFWIPIIPPWSLLQGRQWEETMTLR